MRRALARARGLLQWDGERAECELLGGAPALLSVGTRWCGPCAALAPELEATAEALEDVVEVGKLDADDFPELATRLGVEVYPTTFLFRDGAELWRHEGLASARELVQAACSRALSAEEAEVLLLEQPQWR